jgi:hypothetical protein
MKSKLLSAVYVVLVFALAACGNSPSGSANQTTTDSVVQTFRMNPADYGPPVFTASKKKQKLDKETIDKIASNRAIWHKFSDGKILRMFVDTTGDVRAEGDIYLDLRGTCSRP